MLYLDRGTLIEADTFARDALATFIELFGEAHPATGMAMHQLAEVQLAQNALEAASPLQDRAAEILTDYCQSYKHKTVHTTQSSEAPECTKEQLNTKSVGVNNQTTAQQNN